MLSRPLVLAGLLGAVLLLGRTHGVHELGLGVLSLHLTVQGHHLLVPLTQSGAQHALATRLLAGICTFITLLASTCIGHLVFY
jgi:hypothetical protein